ncbi:MAG: nicotinate-nucleotide--dimethylbenzimidazole phosphoribosyltransferase, partial [Halieaceae bacterium]|nr:nicotinate-nucleotide--dimethylbenzimidazole phosphoribosyltransferase [Halieaceae bacterium]
ARLRQDQLTKPQGSLGELENLSNQIAGITGQTCPEASPATIIVAAASHGVCEEGVSAYPAEVTAQMVLNFLHGNAAINVLARNAGAEVVVVDAGYAVSPDGMVAQMESGVVYGLSAALHGEINIEQGQVVEGNFDTYSALRMNEMPVIETHIINSLEAWGGAGEPGTPGIAPALTNAIFAATGKRIRELPLSRFELDSLA